MIPVESYISIIAPVLALIISLVVAYSNSRHRSIDLANKYSDYIIANDGRQGFDMGGNSFEQALFHEAILARDFYLWKSYAHLTSHKRSYFNYVSFLVYVCGWVGMSVEPAFESVAEMGVLNPLYPAGFAAAALATGFMVFTRYESTLYGRFLELRKKEAYQPSYAAIFQAKEKVVDESVIPVIVSFLGCLILGWILEPTVFQAFWNVVILFIVAGNNIQIIRKSKSDKP